MTGSKSVTWVITLVFCWEM